MTWTLELPYERPPKGLHANDRWAPRGVVGRPLCDRGAGHGGLHRTLTGAFWDNETQEGTEG